MSWHLGSVAIGCSVQEVLRWGPCSFRVQFFIMSTNVKKNTPTNTNLTSHNIRAQAEKTKEHVMCVVLHQFLEPFGVCMRACMFSPCRLPPRHMDVMRATALV